MNAKSTAGSARINEPTFSDLFNEYYLSLCYFAEGILKDHSLAKDAVSTVFEKLLKDEKPGELQFPKSYLYRAVLNACQNLSRDTKTRDRHQSAAEINFTANEDDILERIYRAEVYRELFSAIDTLPDKCRQIMHLSYREGLKVDEIAQILKVSSSTVKTQRAIGIKQLRKLLSNAAFFLLMTI